MSTVTVKVPMSENSAMRSGWCYNVSQHIDAGNDVVFVDMNDGSAVEVSRVHMDADGTISVYGKAYAKIDAKAMALAGGGMHIVGGIYGIVAADTSTGKNIHVKI